MSTYILVHGAWHGGWCWHKVVARLEAQGHRVLTPDLPGHGVDRTPPADTTLDSLAERICALLDAADEPVILVGHSFGGTVITQAAERRPAKVHRLIYVAAFVPRNGESTGKLGAADPDTLLNAAMVVAPDRKTATLQPEALKQVLFGRSPDEAVVLARALLVPEGLAGFRAAVATTAENWGRLPRRYVLCSADRAVGPALQRQMASGSERITELAADHSPYFSAPDELAAALAAD